ncbi:unnamed protein product, partial [Prorocentrum cordatum]
AVLATQWFQLLSDASTDQSATIAQHRTLATLLERGDTRVLCDIQGRKVVAWAPGDTDALQRILTGLLREPDPALRPQSLSLLAPIPHFPGVDSHAKLFDLWWHLLLGEMSLYVSLVRSVDIVLQPVEYILLGRTGPRHVRQGLVSFAVATSGGRSPPAIVFPLTLWVGFPAERLPTFMHKMRSPDVSDHAVPLRCRHTSRSPGNIPECRRVLMEILLPGSLSEAGSMLVARFLRRRVLAADMYVAHRDLYASPDALIMECNSPLALGKAWALCLQAVFLSTDRVLLSTSASAESWTALLDQALKDDEDHAITKIEWKASSRNSPSLDNIAEVRVTGETGDSGSVVIDELLAH